MLKEGDELYVLGETIEVYETLGHAPSCITYILEDKVFTGNAYILDVKVVTNLSRGNNTKTKKILEKTLKLAPEGKIYARHGGDTLIFNG